MSPDSSDADFEAQLARAAAIADRDTAVLTWMNEDLVGNSWTPRTRRGLRDSDLLDGAGRPLEGDRLVERLEQLEARRSPVVWLSRDAYLRAVGKALSSDDGREACRRTEISAKSVLVCAAAIAEHADHRTGRSVTASNATLAATAEVPASRMRHAKTVLRALGLLVDRTGGRSCLTRLEQLAAEQLHGGRQEAVAGESLLVVPTRHLSFRASVRSSSPVSSGSPSARGRARDSQTRPKSNRHGESKRPEGARPGRRRLNTAERPPQPLWAARLAAGITDPRNGISGLRGAFRADSGRHLGHVVAAIAEQPIDPARWTAADLVQVLPAAPLPDLVCDQNREAAGGLNNPVGWLRWALGRVDWTAESPSERRAAELARHRARVDEQLQQREREAGREGASAEARAAAVAAVRETAPESVTAPVEHQDVAAGSAGRAAAMAMVRRSPVEPPAETWRRAVDAAAELRGRQRDAAGRRVFVRASRRQ